MVFERYNVLDLIIEDKIGGDVNKVVGVYVWNCNVEYVEMICVKFVVLVIGGVFKVYQYIFNFDVFFGDGIVMVWCVGCCVVNLEFNQFYLICLYYLEVCNFLFIEVLCGEGVYLCCLDGSCFMLDFDE